MKNYFRYSFSILAGLTILLSAASLSGCRSAYIEPVSDKHKGAHVFGPIDSSFSRFLHHQRIEWITLVSWGFQQDFDSPIVYHHDGDSLLMCRHDSSWVERIREVRAAGFKVFFKPHLWLNKPSAGKWRSDVFPANDADWVSWQQSYREFILRYARVAQRAEAEMFCLGMEFTRLTQEKPEFWSQLIREVRHVYSGKLTYAANWYREYEAVSFWGQLDYIGVQAYFPLGNTIDPDLEETSDGWNGYLSDLEDIYQTFQRPILFTEMGYRSTAHSAIKPWEWAQAEDASRQIYSPETQANCYQAFFDVVWPQPWFAGVHIWQLRSDMAGYEESFRLDFTPQGKLAEEVVREGFE